jgi:pantothenate kinase/RimJ/RimL family protein N-acetyltransferase
VGRVIEDLVRRARGLAVGGRAVLGIAGAPGAGKSTLAARLVAELGPTAAWVPMDGFHLADAALDRLGLRDRKGAPETFDAWGYLALLRRLAAETDHPVYAPAFERDLEQPLAGAIAVDPGVRLVVTEGNYLLLDREPWPRVRAALAEVWFAETDEALRRQRLVARHVRFGKPPAEAEAWVAAVDDPNAALVAAGRDRADLVVSLPRDPAAVGAGRDRADLVVGLRRDPAVELVRWVPADAAALADLLAGEDWPFHGAGRPDRAAVLARVAAGHYDNPAARTYWVVTGGERAGGERAGVVRLFDLDDGSPLFDLRLCAAYRGRGLGAAAVRALTALLFAELPAITRIEATTRSDNVAMTRALERCGYVREARYREAWPVPGGPPLDALGYAVLRREWPPPAGG